jgi:hypothetical protein
MFSGTIGTATIPIFPASTIVDSTQSTIDMSKSDIATTVSEDMGQPNTCSTPKSEKKNPFETEVENESEPVVGKGDTMKKNEGVINDTWTVDITFKF